MTLFAVTPAGIGRVDGGTGLPLAPQAPAQDRAWFERLMADALGSVRRAPGVGAGVAASERHRRATASSPGDRLLASLERSRNPVTAGAALVDRGGLAGPVMATGSSAAPIVEARAEASGPNATATSTARAVVNGQVVEKTATDRGGDGGSPDTPGGSSSFSYAFGLASASSASTPSSSTSS